MSVSISMRNLEVSRVLKNSTKFENCEMWVISLTWAILGSVLGYIFMCHARNHSMARSFFLCSSHIYSWSGVFLTFVDQSFDFGRTFSLLSTLDCFQANKLTTKTQFSYIIHPKTTSQSPKMWWVMLKIANFSQNLVKLRKFCVLFPFTRLVSTRRQIKIKTCYSFNQLRSRKMNRAK